MKNNINQVAQTIANKISEFPANQQLGNDCVHKMLGYTKRESEAVLMAAWFLKNVEKMSRDDDKETFKAYRQQLVDKAIKISGK
jgi:hypothetical protein